VTTERANPQPPTRECYPSGRPQTPPPPAGAYAQARLCLDLIGEALVTGGSSLEHLVRTRMFLTGADHWQEVARAHGEIFAGIRPAATAVIVAGLLDPARLGRNRSQGAPPRHLGCPREKSNAHSCAIATPELTHSTPVTTSRTITGEHSGAGET
jgi:hypothetical protein